MKTVGLSRARFAVLFTREHQAYFPGMLWAAKSTHHFIMVDLILAIQALPNHLQPDIILTTFNNICVDTLQIDLNDNDLINKIIQLFNQGVVYGTN